MGIMLERRVSCCRLQVKTSMLLCSLQSICHYAIYIRVSPQRETGRKYITRGSSSAVLSVPSVQLWALPYRPSSYSQRDTYARFVEKSRKGSTLVESLPFFLFCNTGSFQITTTTTARDYIFYHLHESRVSPALMPLTLEKIK